MEQVTVTGNENTRIEVVSISELHQVIKTDEIPNNCELFAKEIFIMATSVFEGFKIKGIDDTRLPPLGKRGMRARYNSTGDEIVEHLRYTVYILLEPIRYTDDNPLPNVDSKIRQIWKGFFNEGSRQLVNYHQEEEQRRNPGDPDLPLIRVTYYGNGDCGEIRIYNTHLQEVEELMSEPNRFNNMRKLKPLVEWVNQKTLRELEGNIL